MFSDEQRLACSKCHSVDRKSDKAGPDLFAVGDKFGRRELINAVLAPSATIADSYGTKIFKTKSGEEFSGVVKEATDEWVDLIFADALRIRVLVKDIEEWPGSEVFIIPEGFHSGKTLSQFNHLIQSRGHPKHPQSPRMVFH